MAESKESCPEAARPPAVGLDPLPGVDLRDGADDGHEVSVALDLWNVTRSIRPETCSNGDGRAAFRIGDRNKTTSA